MEHHAVQNKSIPSSPSSVNKSSAGQTNLSANDRTISIPIYSCKPVTYSQQIDVVRTLTHSLSLSDQAK